MVAPTPPDRIEGTGMVGFVRVCVVVGLGDPVAVVGGGSASASNESDDVCWPAPQAVTPARTNAAPTNRQRVVINP